MNLRNTMFGGYFVLVISTDFGSSWIDISSGMKNIYTSSLFKSDNYLFANTINGIWKRPLSEIMDVQGPEGNATPQDYSLSQNYPNPFNPTTNFEFRISNFGLVVLKVFDVLGKEVATLVNEEKHAGVYVIKFDASNLASGVYFYQLKANNFIDTKKFMLLK
ncbi:MAG TPA: T9SS type A sorting domain-containing protein [Ignavibacteriaceae bacterium]|nr:T9SS type A sorting domain-containing protein [Ignavibacteriaceae bacterium]